MNQLRATVRLTSAPAARDADDREADQALRRFVEKSSMRGYSARVSAAAPSIGRAGGMVTILFLIACGPAAEQPDADEVAWDAGTGAGPETLEAYVARIGSERAQREQRLRRSDGWLTVVGMYWLEPGRNSLGSNPANDIVLPAPLPASIGYLEVFDDRAELVARPDANVVEAKSGDPIERLLLQAGQPLDATAFRVGRHRFFTSRFQGRLVLRMQDPAAPALSAFQGNDHFPIDPRWRVDARIEPHLAPRAFDVPIFGEGTGSAYSGGVLVFELDGREHRLEILRPSLDRQWLFTIFSDASNGSDTYPAGRYLWAERLGGNEDRTVIDFNGAFNPPCVYSPFTLCELAPPQNRLEVAVRAGEKWYGRPGADSVRREPGEARGAPS